MFAGKRREEQPELSRPAPRGLLAWRHALADEEKIGEEEYMRSSHSHLPPRCSWREVNHDIRVPPELTLERQIGSVDLQLTSLWRHSEDVQRPTGVQLRLQTRG